MDEITLSVTADLLINFAAGWFGLVFIAPPIIKHKSPREKLILLTWDIITGILCLVLADLIRRLI